ncbi:mast/stem cell growth factor receptor kita-like isoform X2 [Planococcus citri]
MRITFLTWCFAYCIISFTTFGICTSTAYGHFDENEEKHKEPISYHNGIPTELGNNRAEDDFYHQYSVNTLSQDTQQPKPTDPKSKNSPNGNYGRKYNIHDVDTKPHPHNEQPKYNLTSLPRIVNPDSNYTNMTEGEDLTLTCTVNITYYDIKSNRNKPIMEWILPNSSKIVTQPKEQELQEEFGHGKLSQKSGYSYLYRPYTIKWVELSHTLTIDNLTEKNDQGNYTCKVFNYKNEATVGTYLLNISRTYLYNNTLGNHSNLEIILKDFTSEHLEWIVNLTAYPIAAVNWYDPMHKYINSGLKEDPENRIDATYDGNTTKLKIRDLKVYDSGIYRMRAFHLRKAITLKFNLTVSGKPTIRMYQFYPHNTLVCVVDAFPRVKAIKWTREGCSNENSGDCEVQILRHRVMNEYRMASVINLTEHDDLKTFTCEAKNELGEERNSTQFKYITLKFNEASVNSFRTILYVAFAIFVIVFGAILVLLIVMILIQENKNANKIPKKNRLSMFDTRVIRQLNPRIDVEEQAHLLPYDSKWEFPKEKLYLGKMIGSGAFGLIKKAVADGIGETTSPTAVAVKTIERNSNRLYMRLLASELKLLIYVGNHANLVNLLGACTLDFDTKKEFSTIVDYCKYGNLRDFLLIHRNSFINQLKENDEIDFSITRNVKRHKLPSIMDMPQSKARKYLYPADWRSYFQGDYRITNIKSVTTNDLIRWSYQATCGMDYLARRKVLHSDLTARNLLLNDDKTVKICNFGLAKNVYQQDEYREIKTILLPMKWMALESIKLRKFSTQSDIWSFGVTMWEIFSLAEIPFPDINTLESLYEILKSGDRLEKPPFASNELYALMKDCWNYNETTRPSFNDLGNKLTHILERSIQSSSNENETRKLEMAELYQNIHLKDKINASQEIILQIASTHLSTSNSSDLNRNSIEMKPRNSYDEKKSQSSDLNRCSIEMKPRNSYAEKKSEE